MPKLIESQRLLRDHAFYPTRGELAKIPPLYATDEIPASDKIIYLHYSIGGCDWYIAELDLPWRHNPESDNTPGLAFGYAQGLGSWNGGEWGYIPLPELEEVRIDRPPFVIERDPQWAPKRFSDIGCNCTPDTIYVDCATHYREVGPHNWPGSVESQVWPC